jgi:hypothetical protein
MRSFTTIDNSNPPPGVTSRAGAGLAGNALSVSMSIAWPIDHGVAERLRRKACLGESTPSHCSGPAEPVLQLSPAQRSERRPSLHLRCELTFDQAFPDADGSRETHAAHAGVRVVLVLVGSPESGDQVLASPAQNTILTAADTSSASVRCCGTATTVEIPGLLTAVFRTEDALETEVQAHVETDLHARGKTSTPEHATGPRLNRPLPGAQSLIYVHTGLLDELGVPGGRCGVPTGCVTSSRDC